MENLCKPNDGFYFEVDDFWKNEIRDLSQKEQCKVKVLKLNERAKLPTKGSPMAAGFDLYACIEREVNIMPSETVKIPTGLSIQTPEGHFGAIFARSGIAVKKGLRPCNGVGVLDEDFRGECIVALHNDSELIQTVNPDERIAQIVFIKYNNVQIDEVASLDKTERGSGGFGSTGV